MEWYIAKLVYKVVCGNGEHTPQFDEQLRLIEADDAFHAFHKARILGHCNEEMFYNKNGKQVNWKFIDVSELNAIKLTDGTELYSKIVEDTCDAVYTQSVKIRSNNLFSSLLANLN